MHKVFEHELREIYDVEERLLEALQEMSKEVSDQELRVSLEQHRDLTEKQAGRLERVFELTGVPRERATCHAIEGLVTEFREFAGKHSGRQELDTFTTIGGVKAEFYEMATYGALIKLADELGHSEEAIGLLHQSLEEEKQAAQELEQIGNRLMKLGRR